MKMEISGTVEVDTDVMQTTIDTLNEELENLASCYQIINSEINDTLKGIWTGADASTFIDNANIIIKNINHINLQIKQHAENLSKIKSNYEELDQNFGNA